MAKKKLYPIQIDMNVAITNDETGQSGSVKFGYGYSQVPDEKMVEEAVKKSMQGLPDGFRLMTRHEHFLTMVEEKTGVMMKYALPVLDKDEEWHDPATADVPSSWGRDHDEEC